VKIDLQKARTLCNLRASKGIKASWVAKQMGISAPHLCLMESGKRTWSEKLEKKFRAIVG